MARANDLGKDDVKRLVIRLAIPAMVANFVNVLYSIVDRIFIGNIENVGELALAGVGICGPIVTLLSSFGTLIGLGGSILMAMKMGENNKKQAESLLANSFLMLVLCAVFLTLFFFMTKDYMLIWFGASDVTFLYADAYMSIYTLGTFFALMTTGLNYFINCQGFAANAMISVLIGAISNIILDPVFIFGFDMGVAGAAWATVISQCLSFIYTIIFLFGKKVPVKINFGGYSLSVCKKIVSIGMSPFIILAFDSVIIIFMNAMLQKTGGSQGDLLISSVTIVQSFFMLITGPLIGISGGTQAIISFNYGAGYIDRIKKAEKDILILCIIFTGFMCLVSHILPQYFVRIFTSSKEHIEIAVWGIKVFSLAVVPLSFQYCFVDCLTALGRVKTALFLSLQRKAVYCLLIVIFAFNIGARNAFFAQPVADFFCSVFTSIIFLKVFFTHINKEKDIRL